MAAWTRTPTFDVRALVDAFGNVPWPLMQASFHMLRPTLRAAEGASRCSIARGTTSSSTASSRSRRWGNDNVSFPGACYARYIEELYRGNALVRGGFAARRAPRRARARSRARCSRSRSRTITSCRSASAAPLVESRREPRQAARRARRRPRRRGRLAQGGRSRCGRRCRRSGRSATQ